MRSALFLVLTMVCGCGLWVGSPKKPGQGGGSETPKNVVNIAGQLVPGAGLAADMAADSVLAMRIDRGVPKLDDQLSQPIALEADGRFSIDLPKLGDWIVVFAKLHDPELPPDAGPVEKLERVVGYLAFPAGSTRDLVQIPAFAAQADVDAGTVMQIAGSDLARASRSVDDLAGSFTTSAGKLREMALTSDSLRLAKNAFANPLYKAEPMARFHAPSFDENYYHKDPESILKVGKFSDPNVMSFVGFGVAFDVKDPVLELDRLCAPESDATHQSLEIVPPSEIVLNGIEESDNGTWGPDRPFDNAEADGVATSIDGKDRVCELKQLHIGPKYGESLRFNIGSSLHGLPAPVPSGLWTVRADGVTTAAFDLAPGNPVDAGGHPRTFVPSIRYLLDDEKHLSRVEIKMHYWDPDANAYVAITDPASLQEIMRDMTFSLQEEFGHHDGPLAIDALQPAIEGDVLVATEFTHKWVAPGAEAGDGETEMVGMNFTFSVYGVRVYFALY